MATLQGLRRTRLTPCFAQKTDQPKTQAKTFDRIFEKSMVDYQYNFAGPLDFQVVQGEGGGSLRGLRVFFVFL